MFKRLVLPRQKTFAFYYKHLCRTIMRRSLEASTSGSELEYFVSTANLMTKTFDGIDICGKRLAEEIKECVSDNGNLQYVSVIGHSMGGLIARYAMGVLYDSGSKKICGLTPRHYISLATPHLGCAGDGPAQIPFIAWASKIPVVGGSASKFLSKCSSQFAFSVFKKTGKQFFFTDATTNKQPLLVQLASDCPDGMFYSALKAFHSRTCVANASGDYIVGWSNSSLRLPCELPEIHLGDTPLKGIMRSDDIDTALVLKEVEDNGIKSAFNNEIIKEDINELCPSKLAENYREAEQTLQFSSNAMYILHQLRSLPWCRIDCCFSGASLPWLAHNLIQATNEWLHWEGEEVTKHIASHFFKLEARVKAASNPDGK